ncbi:3-hydroxyisobutyrate dehydrogenase [Mycena indigotica]|uniref:3-hydroxyisobutyrate dehydrogenase n=1 Tax=Mycena indigotica TaxID=2126181 RepID=A0A8H6TAX2_9AGAR|nr:3-hydroxyisobutyrate dehydrogenase [Mycena indigotica]KAF7315410.1 3-hydroxyisobutyrate dehydrogenase [Mycena indigotica]
MLPPQRLGWIGLGAMGWPMAKQLLANYSSATLTVYDIEQSLLEKFASEEPERVKIASNAKQTALESDWVFTIVPEGKHVRQVYLDEESGILAADIIGKTFIDCSTIDLETSSEVGAAVISAKAACFVDAPVSGGTAGAAKGTITFMVGIAPEDPYFPVIQTILSTMGRTVNAMGGKGLGLAAKLSNNYLSGCIAIALSEAMSIGMKLGIEPKLLSDTFDKGTGANWVNKVMNPVPGVCPDAATSKGYIGGFKVELMEKDVRLATQAAHQVGVKLALGDAVVSTYSQTAADPAFRGKDSRVVYQWLNHPSTE